MKLGDKIYLLDWEFFGLNDFYYDIVLFGNIDFKDVEKLLGYYLECILFVFEFVYICFYRMY